MTARYSLGEIPALHGRKVFFDANILVYLFWPSGSYHYEIQYATAFNRLMEQDNTLVVDFLVISELINRAFRLEYEKYLRMFNRRKEDLPFKHFRDSPKGHETEDDIYLIVKDSLLPRFQIAGKAFSKAEIENFLSRNSMDFNDKAIVLTCKEHDYILLTNDRDFAAADIEILSAHTALLDR